MKYKLIAFTFVASILVSCASKKASTDTSKEITTTKKDDTTISSEEVPPMISLQTSSCRHRCPVYLIEIMEDGSAKMYGQKFFKIEGRATSKLSGDQMTKLEKLLLDSEFYSLNDVYDNDKVQDIPPLYLTANRKGKTKSIKSRYNSPEKLIALQSYLQDLANVLQWELVK